MEEDFKKIKMNLSNINLDLDVGYFPLVRVKNNKEVLEKKLSSKNPIKGTVRLKQTVSNQNGDIVMTWISNSMIKVKTN